MKQVTSSLGQSSLPSRERPERRLCWMIWTRSLRLLLWGHQISVKRFLRAGESCARNRRALKLEPFDFTFYTEQVKALGQTSSGIASMQTKSFFFQSTSFLPKSPPGFIVATKRKPAAALISSTSSLSPLPFSASTRDFSVSRTLTTDTTHGQSLFIYQDMVTYVAQSCSCLILLLKMQHEHNTQSMLCTISYKVRHHKSALFCICFVLNAIKNCIKSLERSDKECYVKYNIAKFDVWWHHSVRHVKATWSSLATKRETPTIITFFFFGT